MFGNRNKKSKWKMEYEDTIYKIYDWNRNLAGYFFPDYDLEETKENEMKLLKNLTSRTKVYQEEIFSFPW